MAKRSPLFIAGAGLLLVLNLGLGWAVVDQQQSSVSADAIERLESEKALVTVRLEAGNDVVRQKARIEANNQAITQKLAAISNRLYVPEDRSSLEMDITRAIGKAKGKRGNLSLQQIEVKMTEEGPALRRWTYSVALRGTANLLPPLAEEIYQNKKLGMLGRVAATSPNFSFKDLDMVMDIHYYQVVEASPVSELRKSVEGAFHVPRTSLLDSRSDGVNTLNSEVGALQQSLSAMGPRLLKLASLEADTAQKKKVLEAHGGLVDEWQENQKIIKESLPKLYLRIRSSTLGGAAILVDGSTVTFPEYSGED